MTEVKNEKAIAFHIKDCNYALLSDERKKRFKDELSELFFRRTSFDFIIVSDVIKCQKEIFVRVYDDNEANFIITRELLTRITGSAVQEYTVHNVGKEKIQTLFGDKDTATLVCDKWGEELKDTFLSSISTFTHSVTTVSFRPAGRKGELLYAQKTNDAKIRSKVMKNGEPLYCVTMTMAVSKAAAFAVVDYATDFHVTLSGNKTSKANKKAASKRYCTIEVFGNMIPFYNCEFDDSGAGAYYYGMNALSQKPVMYNRRGSKLPCGIISGCAASGKSFYVKREILQTLEQTDDDIFVIDPDADYARLGWWNGAENKFVNDERYHDCLSGKMKRIDFWHGDNYVNPMDFVLPYLFYCSGNESEMELNIALQEKAQFVIGFLETFLFNRSKKEFNNIQVQIIHDAVISVLKPFAKGLIERKLTHDFETNPTLTDLIAEIRKSVTVESYDNEDTMQLIEAVRKTTNDNRTERNEKLASVIETSLQEIVDKFHKNRGKIQQLFDLLEANQPYLERFSHKTTIANERAVVFGLEHCPVHFTPAAYCVIYDYVYNRKVCGIEKGKYTWLYLEEADTLFLDYNERIADCIVSTFKRHRVNQIISTLVVQGIGNLLESKTGASIFNNSGFMVFLAQAPYDRDMIKKICNFSDKLLEYTKEPSYGAGILYNNHQWTPFFTGD